MSVPITRKRFQDILSAIGRSTISALYPNDFEYYACAIELVDSRDNVVKSLIFPVMPNSIKESSTSISNVKKTIAGVISIFNPTFIPIDINIGGSFGRKFRVLIDDKSVTFSGIVGNLVRGKSVSDYEPPEFDVRVKTGYGVSKVLQTIYDQSFGLDNYGQPYKCFFYNLALNTHYLVELKNLTWDQTTRENMMWGYNIQMKAIAPAYSIKKNLKSSLINILTFSNVSKGATTIFDEYTDIFRVRQSKFQ